jgi:hypothetical protein
MKKLTLLFVVTSLFVIFPTIAAADHYSDGKLLQKTCTEALKLFDSRATADPFQAGSCLGYIRAANDMYEIMVNNANRTICIPSGLDVKHLIMVVIKYLNENPGKLQNVASASVYEAFQQYFPCVKPEPEK